MNQLQDFNNWNNNGGIPTYRLMAVYYIKLFDDIYNDPEHYSLGVSLNTLFHTGTYLIFTYSTVVLIPCIYLG